MTREEAIEIATGVAQERGWPWIEPIWASLEAPRREALSFGWRLRRGWPWFEVVPTAFGEVIPTHWMS